MVTPADAREKAVSLHEGSVEKFVRHYDDMRSGLDSPFLYGRRRIGAYFDRIVARLPQGANVLDAGCGTGEQLLALHESGFAVVGIDPAARMRGEADKKLPLGTVRNGSVLELPFESESFDFVYSLEVFRYLTSEDTMRGFREIRRVLRPGGIFFGTFVNRFALDGFAMLVMARRLRATLGAPINCHTEFETPRGLERKLFAAGFRHAEAHGAMFAPVRILWKALGGRITAPLAHRLEGIDSALSDGRLTRPLAAHLIGISTA